MHSEVIKQWNDWWDKQIDVDMPLFDNQNLEPVILESKGKYGGRFKHGTQIEEHIKSIIRKVKDGSTQHDGVIYMMYKIRNGLRVPLYIGKSEFKGIKRKYSYNATNLSTAGPFMRWGAPQTPHYHFGALFAARIGHEEAPPKYQNWHKAIFNERGLLREQIYLVMIPMKTIVVPYTPYAVNVTNAENSLISLASHLFPNDILNREGKARLSA